MVLVTGEYLRLLDPAGVLSQNALHFSLLLRLQYWVEIA